MRIAILGAGVAGLSAAIAFRRAGIVSEIYDGSENPLAGGVAFTLWPNALRALQELSPEAEAWPEWLRFVEYGDVVNTLGQTIYQLPINWMKSSFGFSPTCVRRQDLMKWLWSVAGKPKIARKTVQCVRLRNEDKMVEALFENGERGAFDAVIVADGIRSAARTALVGREVVRGTNYLAWRGIAQTGAIPENTMREYWDSGIRFGYASISASETYWFATVNQACLEDGDDSWGNVSRLFRDYPEDVHACIQNTGIDDVYQHQVQDVFPSFRLAYPGILLVGDAGHAITPNLGLGACLALEDGAVLMRLLQNGGSVEDAFLRFSQLRTKRVRAIRFATRWLGELTQIQSSTLSNVRNRCARYAPDAVTRYVWAKILRF